MDNLPNPAGEERKQLLLTFATSEEAQICAVPVNLTAAETARLRASLDQLVEIGAVALYQLGASQTDALTWHGLVGLLRLQFGTVCADAAIAASAFPSTPTPKPQTLVPVWAFESDPCGSPAVTAWGVFARAPIVFEALPLDDADSIDPLPAVADQLAGWKAAMGGVATLGAAFIPGQTGPFAVFASVRAA